MKATTPTRFPANVPLAGKPSKRSKGLSLRDLHPCKVSDMAAAAASCGFHNLSDALNYQADIQKDAMTDYLDQYGY